MKLAEGLLLRSDIQKKLLSLQARAQRYVVVQEGESPAEDPQVIFREIDALAQQFERLIFIINRANLHFPVYQVSDIQPVTATGPIRSSAPTRQMP